MKVQKLLFSVFSITLLSLGGWFAVLQTVDPFNTDWFSIAMFYVFALVAICGVITMVMYYIRKRKSQLNAQNLLYSCIRQGLIISLGLVGLAILQTINVLNVLSASVYIIALVLIEFYFRSRRPDYA